MKAVIFDLDGVIVTTDNYHYEAWKMIADDQGIYFDKDINERLRGVSRMESLDIILERSEKKYSDSEKLKLAEKKNSYYKKLLGTLSEEDILPGVEKTLQELKEKNVKIAIGSSSKNTMFILDQIGYEKTFDAIADGTMIKNSKPNPEVFLLAAEKLGIAPSDCLVVEDAEAGVEAALNAKMKVLGVGSAKDNLKADYRSEDLSKFNIAEVL